MYGLPGDNEMINYDTAWQEAETLQEILCLKTGDPSISIGINEQGKYDCEYWVESEFVRLANFNNLDDVENYIRENYTEWNEDV
jgi:hypothetical protein